jgi:hypothetical protein
MSASTHLAFETWPIDRLIEYARNPRKNDHAVDRVAAAIREFGFRVPIVAKSDGLVVDGHLRLKAAKKLGLAEVPVILADDMTDAQVKAFRLSVNKVAELAEWDDELLALEFDELKEMNFDLQLTSFTDGEISNLFLDREQGETNAAEEWQGMPEFEDPDPCFRKVVVNFDSEEDVAVFFKAIGQKDTGKTKSIWFPEKERRDLESLRWAADDEE